MTEDEKYMSKAIKLAKNGAGAVSPNPMVGAVVVNNRRIVGSGYHEKFGGSHAEVNALQKAGKNAYGSILYVSLEPCSTKGKTPPCVHSIIASKIKRVVIGTKDPNPAHNGRAIEILRNSGIKVTCDILKEKSDELIEGFAEYQKTGLPFVTVKAAVSLDGKIATRSGDSKWISCDKSRRHAHQLRWINDAVMVGSSTVISDDPLLTVRFRAQKKISRQPLRCILDTKCSIPLDVNMFSENMVDNTIVFCSEKTDKNRVDTFNKQGIKTVCLHERKGMVPVKEVLQWLGDEGITSVLIEGGGELIGSAFDEEVVDKIVWFVSPQIIGGKNAVMSVSGKGVDNVKDAWKIKRMCSRKIGDDWLFKGYL
ncbi:MAG: bifunctional diaminohydroxyphosphoribosylaminopyrimidine deaminase/5-amino-6-(5-phosphoribosylamino)uracil reductase RibD [Candidatus Theseobacter exili]|nr:bifunctional diaminohydroxyphosphoribosylaminopyrimidine deaminase/5-amino-6-(5-phosphoribosylamino)uracil reductase RibD [Candidatus Theseobacter exili]